MATEHYLEQWIAVAASLKGVNQLEVGDKAGYEKTHFNKIVTGALRLSRDKARNISEALTAILGYPVGPDDLRRPPPITNGLIDTAPKRSQVAEPTGKEDNMLPLARPVIATLVQKLGLETVIREAVRASNELTSGEAIHPRARQKT